MAYSTIRPKMGQCSHPGCKYNGPLIGGKCQTHYWNGVKMKSAAKFEDKDLSKDKTLQDVIDDMDAVFSTFIRLRYLNDDGFIYCYCCGVPVRFEHSQCMHFIPRKHMHTRFLEENCKAGCPTCNEVNDGNMKAYGDHLEQDRPGSVEMLEEQGMMSYKWSVSELKERIAHYTKEIKRLKMIKGVA